MKRYDKILVLAAVGFLLCVGGVNLAFWRGADSMKSAGRPYVVEVERIAHRIEEEGFENVDLSVAVYVTGVERYQSGNDAYVAGTERYQNENDAFFEGAGSDYMIRVVGGELYRFDYTTFSGGERRKLAVMANIGMLLTGVVVAGFLLFVRVKILKPFEELSELPYELAKGNLTRPVKEYKNRFFGKFVWGVDLLRENLEQQKKRELALLKEKKTLLLSLSHDIKNPLSSIKLCARALSGNLYADSAKQKELAGLIQTRADEIESFVTQIVRASSEDFMGIQVEMGEFYLSDLIREISAYYREKLALLKIPFSVGAYSDALLRGDLDRSVEVLQNIMENAIKYGDGHGISLQGSKEEDCVLVTVQNSGCTLSEAELPHVFDSFWRGSNVGNQEGSGLGLYICRQIMHKMNGEVFAERKNGGMGVTVVFGCL
ncbi:MAG: HAMP domain-containing histidine kinase [Candidatus Gastranaerophilales bacterium]|nr:HAMP domain-containing histidine kinase [Candidatus Gastranaerophilales bacterium]